MTWILTFVSGFLLPLRAAQLIFSNRRVLLLSLIPILTSIGLSIFLFASLQDWVSAYAAARLAAAGVATSGFLATVVNGIVTIAVLLAAALTFSAITNLVSIPFNDLIAESTEKALKPPLQGSMGFSFKLLWIDLLKTLFSAATLFTLLLVSFIPVVNILCPPLAALAMTFQFVSYPQTRRGIGLRGGLAFVRRNVFICAGFGFALIALFALPLISTLAIPLAVVGGTLLFAQTERSAISISPRQSLPT